MLSNRQAECTLACAEKATATNTGQHLNSTSAQRTQERPATDDPKMQAVLNDLLGLEFLSYPDKRLSSTAAWLFLGSRCPPFLLLGMTTVHLGACSTNRGKGRSKHRLTTDLTSYPPPTLLHHFSTLHSTKTQSTSQIPHRNPKHSPNLSTSQRNTRPQSTNKTQNTALTPHLTSYPPPPTP